MSFQPKHRILKAALFWLLWLCGMGVLLVFIFIATLSDAYKDSNLTITYLSFSTVQFILLTTLVIKFVKAKTTRTRLLLWSGFSAIGMPLLILGGTYAFLKLLY